MILSKLRKTLNERLSDHYATLKWILNTHRPQIDKERVENRIEVYEEILKLLGKDSDCT